WSPSSAPETQLPASSSTSCQPFRFSCLSCCNCYGASTSRKQRRPSCDCDFLLQPLDKPTATCCLNSSHILLNCKNPPPIPRVACAIVADTHKRKSESARASRPRQVTLYGSLDSLAKS